MVMRSYRAPGAVIDEWLSRPRHEGRLLAMLMAGCVMIGLSTLPHLLAQPGDVPRDARIAAVMFAWLAIAPLAFYGIALLIDGIRRVFGRGSNGYETRLALFWTMLAATPFWLLNGIGLTIPEPAIRSALGLAAFCGALILGVMNLRAAYRHVQ